jgi:uncharacterized damage-inducible protein DinB
MIPSVTLEELLAWNEEAAQAWCAHLAEHPALLVLPCDIGGAQTVQALVRHVWGVELRWAQRIAGLSVTEREAMPAGPLDALYELHTQATAILRGALADAAFDWGERVTLRFPMFGPDPRDFSRRKLAAHFLFHSQRHYAQLATLLRQAGHGIEMRGDLLFSAAIL